ncbi:MAG: rplA [Candidatus Saccharibacteria bacterium]|nr:rplA [Candidatus Saccharibacteria bacterium]MDB5181787.1 rplA [Candidatus Saccharibacteria bacterium]
MAEANKKTKTTKETPAVAEDAITNAEVADVVAEKTEVSVKDATPAKAGKRSAKAQEAAEVKSAKEERKAAKAGEDLTGTDEAPKQKHQPTRSRLERQGKNFRKVAEAVEKDKAYSLEEALELATKTSPVKFDATVELHVNLRVDPRHADQNIRDNFVLPQGTGKTVRVAVFADVDDAAAAKKAGADIAGLEEVTKLLEKGNLDFDILVATPTQMAKLGKYARALGPRGLMPNPKSGTVTTDVVKAVKEAKAGRVEYRVDSTGIVHLGMGKVSFGKERLLENAQAIFANLKGNKPASVKGTYVKSIHISTTMGPSITVENSAL